MRIGIGIVALLLAAPAAATPLPQTEADAYTRYELLAPGSAKFRILYEITATTPGATAYFNPIRPGSIASDEHVFDRATGKPLAWDVVDAATAEAGGVRRPDPGMRFIRVRLARPVPAVGGARILIDKTYEDPASYKADGDRILFDRPLGIKRNAVVLPSGYVLLSANVPSQMLQTEDGRTMVSFWNALPAEAPLHLVARRTALASASPLKPRPEEERAHQSRNIVYYLNPPETHSFALTHDYTETRPGTAEYVNIVRTGSKARDPSALDLDTGEALRWELIRGAAVAKAEPEASDVGPDTEAVLFHFAPVKPGESLRLRIAETYVDEAHYHLDPDGRLVWDRSLGRADNAVVLPAGWALETSNIPCTVSQLPDGRTRLDYINNRPDEIAVRITARRVLRSPERGG